MIFEGILLVILVVVSGLLLYARWNYGSLEKLGIPVVKPHLFLGSNPDGHKYVSHELDLARFKQYGPVFGVYEGRHPMIYICDPEIIKHVFVKDYEYFHTRRVFDTGDKVMNESVDWQPHDKWKAIRSMISPIFTIARLKGMNEDMVGALDDFSKDFDAEIESSPGKRFQRCDVYDKIFNMLCDLIARCVFSVKVDRNKAKDNFLAQTLKKYMAPVLNREESGYMATLANVFPILRGSAPFFDPDAADSFITVFRNIVNDRKKSGHKKDDIINQVIAMLERVETEEYKKLGITELTVMAQTVVFFMAGQDQFSIVTTHLAYQVAKNLEIEKRLCEEIDAFLVRHKGEIKHDNLNELVYTHACVQESLRHIPPFSRPERMCMKDWSHNGLFIPKGTTVVAPLFPINRHPDYFEKPDAFIPERFLPENKDKLHPFAFSTFGHGPKNCIAYRFNYEVLTVMAVKLFSKYRFIATQDTKLAYKPGCEIFCSPEPIYMDVVKRQ